MRATTLKTALLSNALFSVLSVLIFIIFSPSVAELMGIGQPVIYQILGVGLLGFAGVVAWTGTREPIDTLLAALISIADFAWVVGTLILITVALGALQPAGIGVLLAIAAIVLFFGVRQLQGIGKVYAVSGKPRTHMLCVAVDTPASPDEIWSVIADLASINQYSPNITTVTLKNKAEPGIDAVRQCTDVNGKSWSEYCRRYDEQAREVEFEFLADEPDFPYPFKTMLGGWEVEPSEAGSTVNIWFEVTPKYGIAHPIILALMTRNLARDFGDIVARMTLAAEGEAVPVQISPTHQGIRSTLAPCH